MDSVRIKRLLFSRLKAWHIYACALSVSCIVCLLVLGSPAPYDAHDDLYRNDMSGAFQFHHHDHNQPAPRNLIGVKENNRKSPQTKFTSWSQSESSRTNINNNTKTQAGKGNGSVSAEYSAFLRQPIINHHDFRYLINQPGRCQGQGQTVDAIIVTPSAPANFFRRMKARQEQKLSGVISSSSSLVVHHLFFLGATNDSGIQAKVEAESQVYADIIQEDYLDVYKNITFKAVQMLKWVSEFCSNSKYVLRLDDDVKADVFKLLGAMKKARDRYGEFVMGTVKRGWPPCRIPKCRTTKEEYPYATLPPFALGGALGYPTSSVLRLYEATKRLKLFKLDDVYITGMCAPRVHVILLEDAAFAFQHHAW